MEEQSVREFARSLSFLDLPIGVYVVTPDGILLTAIGRRGSSWICPWKARSMRALRITTLTRAYGMNC